MVRIKMPLRRIEGEKHRNTTFMKRRAVIKKKAMELGKLCDIVTLVVCFGPRGQLETWPDDRQEVRRIIDQYRSLNPDECIKRRYGLATFFEGHLKRLQAELARRRSSWLDASPLESLEEQARSIDAKLSTIEERIGHLTLEEESKGKEEVWVQSQQPEYAPEEVPPDGPHHPLLDAISAAQPVESFEGLDLSVVKPEKFEEKGLRGHAAAAASVWGNPHELHIPEMPCTLPHPTSALVADPFMLPLIADHDFGMDVGAFLDDPFISSPFFAMDFSTYPAAAAAVGCTSSVTDVLNPTMAAFPPSFWDDTLPSYGGSGTSVGSSNMPPLDHSVDAGYSFPLHRLPATPNPAAIMREEVFHKSEFYGDEFFQESYTARPSVAEAWPSSIFHDLPPAGCSSHDSTGGDDSSKFVPNFSTNSHA